MEQQQQQQQVRERPRVISNLNPLAKEFVPSWAVARTLSADAPVFVLGSGRPMDVHGGTNQVAGNMNRNDQEARRVRMHGTQQAQRRRDMYQRQWISQAELADSIRRTIYISDIDQHVTEEELARLFGRCGLINDCRVCAEPGSVLHFAFIEFHSESAVPLAKELSGVVLGSLPIWVAHSRTAILPVNPSFLPRGVNERCMVRRTVYCSNIDKKVSEYELKGFFESQCGKISRMRLLGDRDHPTRIAFVEFVEAAGAHAALSRSGTLVGTFPISVFFYDDVEIDVVEDDMEGLVIVVGVNEGVEEGDLMGGGGALEEKDGGGEKRE
ncbi:hypothetical protein J5N97_004372 [Dioscorea zingiberensis]|uniref:RRM domain-containing protein n=1 Tax=Dioscorea zingiberensis TaxID=325984 RepID=A0A9D5D634_9LILI|nr:hypothetical protein J5N97_004372 [Dioscorea zingiberensis]